MSVVIQSVLSCREYRDIILSWVYERKVLNVYAHARFTLDTLQYCSGKIISEYTMAANFELLLFVVVVMNCDVRVSVLFKNRTNQPASI